MKIGKKSLSKFCLFFLVILVIAFTINLNHIGFSTNETYNETYNQTIDFNQTVNTTTEENITNTATSTNTSTTTTVPIANDSTIETNTTSTTTTVILENKTIEIQVAFEIGDEVKDTENNTVGKKIEDESGYETFFTFVGKENDNFIVKFYHNASISLPVWVETNIDYNLTTPIANPSIEIILTVPLVNGKIPKFKLHVGNDSDIFEFGITIITVQSYPTVGGNWIVEFKTTGIADLTIRAIDGTEFGEDIEFLELRCGDSILTTELIDGAVFIENYTCNEAGYETSKVLTAGKHTLEFRFGDDVEYAYNQAGWWNTSWGKRKEII